MTHAEELYQSLGEPSPARPRVVLSQDGTERESPYARECGVSYDDSSVDSLFGNTATYAVLKKEKPEHRMILWHTLQCRKPREIAALMRCSYQTILNVRGQPWFKSAFVRLSQEMGKSAVETFLSAHEIPALERLADLSENAKSESTKLAATVAFLDRIRGKPTVKIEAKSEATVDVAVHDAASLLAERARNEQVLKANGVLVGTN